MKKRVLSFVLILCMVLVQLPQQAFAAVSDGNGAVRAQKEESVGEDEEYGIAPIAEGDIVTYELENGAVLTFDKSTGTITGASLNEATEIEIPGTIEDVPVTIIGDKAFQESAITEIKLPEGLLVIESQAFDFCEELVTAQLPDSVKEIGRNAFYRCHKLKQLNMPANLVSIGNYAFHECYLMENVEIPASVNSIGEGAFCDCRSFTKIELPEGITTIGSNMFKSCYKLEEVVIPASVKSIDSFAFMGCGSLPEITFPEGITEIGNSAFSGCDALTFVKIPDGVVTLSNNAFLGCESLAEIVLPDNLISIGSEVFRYCSNLEKVNFPVNLNSIGGYAFANCEILTEADLPDTISAIGQGAFFGCSALNLLNLPENITEIEIETFKGCVSLKTLEIPGKVTYIGASAFENCSNIKSVIIPNSVERIGIRAFNHCDSLTTITIPQSVVSIGESAFNTCPDMTSVRILNPTVEIKVDAFQYMGDGFLMYGYAGSTTEDYANEHGFTFVNIEGRNLTVKVQKPDGTILENGYSVLWYDENGNPLSETSSTLAGADAGQIYYVEILLEESLVGKYEVLERKKVTPQDSPEILIQLTAVKFLTLTGKVLDQEGKSVADATIKVNRQTGTFETEMKTSGDGSFAVEVPCGELSVIIRKDGYYSKGLFLDLTEEEGDTYSLGECILNIAKKDQIIFEAMIKQAKEEGQEPVEELMNSIESLNFAVTGSDGRSIHDFELQGLTLLFAPDTVRANERIMVSVTDAGGRFQDVKPFMVALDEDGIGRADLILLQKGSYVLDSVSDPSAVLMLFDAAGTCIQRMSAAPGLTGEPLDEGSYTLVLVQKTDLLRSIPNISYLELLGLKAGEDYYKTEFSVSAGSLTRIYGCEVPALDESKISYTVTGTTSLSVNKAGRVAQGELFMLCVAYELDPAKNVSAQEVQVILPEGIELTEGQLVLVDGTTVRCQYNADTREITIPVSGKNSSSVYLYCMASVITGEHIINGYLKLRNGVVQPVGSAKVRVEKAAIMLPERTSSEKNIVSGITFPRSEVEIFDNDKIIGRVRANAAGNWSAEVALAEPLYQYSYHFLHAAISLEGLAEKILTEEKLVIYDERTVELSKITMYNLGDYGEQETVFNYTDASSKTPVYLYAPRFPTFTFKVEFKENKKLSEVFVITRNNLGEETYVETVYDEAADAWIGYHDYTGMMDIPAQVSVSYVMKDMEEIPLDEQRYLDIRVAGEEAYEEINAALLPAFEDTIYLSDITVEDNVISGTVVYQESSESGEQILGDFQTRKEILGNDITEEVLKERGYQLADDELISTGIIPQENKGKIWLKQEVLSDGREKLVFADLANSFQMEITISSQESGISKMWLFSGDPDQYAISLGTQYALWALGIGAGLVLGGALAIGAATVGLAWVTVGGILTLSLAITGLAQSAWESALCKKQLVHHISGRQDELLTRLEACTKALAATCEDGSFKLSDTDRNTFYQAIRILSDRVNGFMNDSMKVVKGAQSVIAGGSILSLGTTGITSAASRYGKEFEAVGNFTDDCAYFSPDAAAVAERIIDTNFNGIYSDLYQLLERIKSSYQPCDEEPEPDPEAEESPVKDMSGLGDPSGYVYEAVPSNRLSEVKAVLSSKEGGEWNAEDYNQVNPQMTQKDGGYRWDVPEGNWKVTFTKEGYENADTSKVPQAENGWLPVPPPQLGINVGMIAKASPAVEVAVAYTDQAEVVFSQYMDIESVEKALALSRNNAAVKVKVVALDAEDNADGTKQYATRFALIPEDGDLSGVLQVTVEGTACNYAGKPIGEPYASGELKAVQRPVDIEVAEEIYVVLHENSKLPLTLLPGVAGQKLVVENLTPSLISLAAGEVTTGEAGKAEISLEGLLLGSGMLKISEPISGLCKTVKVNIGLTLPEVTKPQPVVATLEDGTVLESGMSVPYGARITLTTPTQGAVIRYTVNDTCPCKEAALTYSGPIEVEESMVQNGQLILRAAACQDGTYSETIRLVLSVAKKENVKIDGVAAAEGLIYNGKAQTGYTGTPSSAYQGEYVISYAGKGETIYGPSSAAPVHAGEYTVTISVPEDQEAYSGSVTLEFAIQKAQITIDADDKEAFVGDAEPAYTYTITGLAVADRLKKEPVLKCEADMTKKGVYLIIPGGAKVPNEEDYFAEIIYVNGLLKLDRKQQPTEPEPSQSPSEQQPTEPEPSQSPSEQPPAETESSQSPSEQPPAETESSQSPSEQPPAETESSQSPSEQPPAETESSQSPSEQPPAETESSQSPSEQLPAETESSQNPSEQPPAETESSQSPSEQLPAETESSQSPSEQSPVETESSQSPSEQAPAETEAGTPSVAPKTDDAGSVELFMLFFLCGLYAAAAASANLRKSRKERK